MGVKEICKHGFIEIREGSFPQPRAHRAGKPAIKHLVSYSFPPAPDNRPGGNRFGVPFHQMNNKELFGRVKMTPFQEIKSVPEMKAVGVRVDVSVWNVDTAFSRLYDRAMDLKLMFKQPALGIRHEGVGIPDPFHSDYDVLFPLTEDAEEAPPGMKLVTLPREEVASFSHRGPYDWISCTYEKVLDWLRENRYEVAGEPREIFLVAPDPHSGGTQDDMLTEIQVPIRLREAA
jgi:effector-binding domain-containing protein